MNYAEKRLELFDKKFGSDLDYIYQIKDIKSFLAKSIHQAEQETLERGKKAWIQGNIISFEKPTYQSYQSAFFDLEEVIVFRSPKDPNTPTV